MLSQEQRDRIIALKNCGYSIRKINSETGFARKTIRNVLSGKPRKKRERKLCNDLIWRAIKVSNAFTLSEIEVLSGCSGSTVRRAFTMLKKSGAIKEAGLDESGKARFRLAFSFRRYECYPVVQQPTSEIVSLADAINKIVQSGMYMDNEKQRCIEMCQQLIKYIEGVDTAQE